MKPIIDPVAREEIERELTAEKKIRNTNKAGNEIYVITAANSPAVMREIGRLREVSFREAGGGTGEEVDIDADDLAENGYQQLIVWDPAAREIVGGYRFIICRSSRPEHLSTEHYFRFSDKFREEFLPWTIELGRSFVQPSYQSRDNNKSIFALDNLWDGLGALTVLNPEIRYFFGKVTMYTDFNVEARNMIIYFMHRYFPDHDELMEGIDPVEMAIDYEKYDAMFTGDNYNEDHRTLCQQVRERGENIPPLINSYMSLSPSMRTFATVHNNDFGAVEETGILITIADIYPAKGERHMKF
ncbi:MAG: GNAT family N-acetyltransferase [Rikenellaceae bacterium]|nr:GNAT family N-acetyltransferase [Rikenellaceae bacterium]